MWTFYIAIYKFWDFVFFILTNEKFHVKININGDEGKSSCPVSLKEREVVAESFLGGRAGKTVPEPRCRTLSKCRREPALKENEVKVQGGTVFYAPLAVWCLILPKVLFVSAKFFKKEFFQ